MVENWVEKRSIYNNSRVLNQEVLRKETLPLFPTRYCRVRQRIEAMLRELRLKWVRSHLNIKKNREPRTENRRPLSLSAIVPAGTDFCHARPGLPRMVR
jgi:hypothetical protein